MRTVFHSGGFRKDLRLMHRRGKDLTRLQAVLDCLAEGRPPPPKMRDHPLKGEFAGCRECHIEPDWLLIYRWEKPGGVLRLERTGTHSDLFG